MTTRGTVREWFSEHGGEMVAWSPYFAAIIFCMVLRPSQAHSLLLSLGILLGVLALRLYAGFWRRHEAEKEAKAGTFPVGSAVGPEATPTLASSTQPQPAAIVSSAVARHAIEAPAAPPPLDELRVLNRWMVRATKEEKCSRFDALLSSEPSPSRASLRRLLADELGTLRLPYEAYVTQIDLPRLALLAGATSDRRLWLRLVRYLKERDEAHRLGQRMSGTSKADLGPHASDERAASWVRSHASDVELPEAARARIDAVLKRYEEEFAAGQFDEGA